MIKRAIIAAFIVALSVWAWRRLDFIPIDVIGQPASPPFARPFIFRFLAHLNFEWVTEPVSRVQLDGHTSSHSLESQVLSAKGIPLGTFMSASIH